VSIFLKWEKWIFIIYAYNIKMHPFASKIDTSFSTETKSKSIIMASVEAFKSAVGRIRDILRGPGVSITGMDSM
jgi:hypothetical protein